MLLRMHELIAKNLQFIIAARSPIPMAYPDANIYSIDESDLVGTAHEKTEHLLVTKGFLGNPGR